MIRVDRASKSFGAQHVLRNVTFEVRRSELFGIIGPNGSGKTTLLRLLSGLDKPSAGTVELEGRSASSYSRKQLASRMAVLQQDALPAVGFTVREVIEMGRYPFQNWLGDEKSDHAAIIDVIMEKLDLQRFADRPLDRLSGGERQRVALAKAMAQQPRLLLLDEPTTYLDIGYQVQMLDYIASWKREADLTVVAVLHDLNLAAQYCDRLLVVHGGEAICVGTPEQIIEGGLIARVYGTQPYVLPHPASGVPQILLRPATIG